MVSSAPPPSWRWVLAIVLFVIALYNANPELQRRSRNPPPPGAQFVQLSRGRTRYALSAQSDGGRSQLVVLVAGLASPFETMLPLARELQKKQGVRTLTYDVYGRGWSDLMSGPIQPGPRVDAYVSQLAELLYALNETGKVTLVGLSMGGAIVSGYARTYPERTEKLLLFAPASQDFGRAGNVVLRILQSLPEWVTLGIGSLVVQKSTSLSMEHEYKTRTDEIQDIKRVVMAQDPNIIVPAIVSNILSLDLTLLLAGYEETAQLFSGPILIVWGEEDAIAPLPFGRALYDRLSTYRTIEFWSIPGFGHFVANEDVSRFPALVSYITA